MYENKSLLFNSFFSSSSLLKIKSFIFAITPKFIDIPDWTDVSVEYEFTGKEIRPEPSNWDIIKTYCNISYIPTSPKESGTYTCNIALNDENYAWKSGNTGTTFEFTIKLNVLYYYGMAAYNLVKNHVVYGVFKLPTVEEGLKSTNEKSFTITKANTFNSIIYEDPQSWYVAVPSNKSVEFVESGLGLTITPKYNITINNIDYSVYLAINKGIYGVNWSLKVSVQ